MKSSQNTAIFLCFKSYDTSELDGVRKRLMNQSRCAAAAAIALGFFATTAHAQTARSWFNGTKIDGTLRSYYFSRLYGSPKVPNQSAYALAGILNARSPRLLGGFEIGGSFFTASALGFNNSSRPPSYPHLDPTLLGPESSLTALGQAYVQYHKPSLLIRVGDQEFNTPWMNESDSRVFPATYQAAFIEVDPVKTLHIIGLREFRWKSRTSGAYYHDNLYYPSTYDGDSAYGGGTALGPQAPKAQGTLAFGASYAGHGIKSGVWYYQFSNFATMAYGDTSYTLPLVRNIEPFVGGQFLREWDGNSLLNANRFGNAIDGYRGNGVNATAYGLQVGIGYALNTPLFGRGSVALSYNGIPSHAGSIGDGAIVSPFTVGYATDPLYTTAMIRGLVELGPGDAKKVAITQRLFNNHVLAVIAFSKFDTKLNGSSNDAYFDVTYSFGGSLKGLSMRDRMEISNASYQFNNGASNNRGHSFVYNRVMIQYNF